MATMTRKTLRVADPADVQDIASDIALDEDQALRENQMLLHGVPLNPEALQQAIASVQQGDSTRRPGSRCSRAPTSTRSCSARR
jgi:hypothetical protein